MDTHSPPAISRFQILSLDGGGIKGIFSAAVLAAIEEDLNVDITEHFDLITGTSTGGIIAIGLGLGLRPREILDIYLNEGKKIFPWSTFKILQHLFFRKFSRSGLTKALEDNFKKKTFGESKKRLIIPSFSLTNNDIYLFRTAHSAHLTRDYKLLASHVAQATSAAPTYFSGFKGIDGNRLIDGGVWANNPIMVAVTEAVAFLGANLKTVSVLSLGTTAAVTERPSYLDWAGKLCWASSAPEVIMEGQSIAATKQAKNLLGEKNVLRINPSVAEKEFGLDKAKFDQLKGKAAHISRQEMPQIKSMFLGHRASEFVPIYK